MLDLTCSWGNLQMFFLTSTCFLIADFFLIPEGCDRHGPLIANPRSSALRPASIRFPALPPADRRSPKNRSDPRAPALLAELEPSGRGAERRIPNC